MTAYRDAQGYEQTKTKLADLQRRQADIENRTDLSAPHREQVPAAQNGSFHRKPKACAAIQV